MDGGEFRPPLRHLCGATYFLCIILIFVKFVVDIYLLEWIEEEQKYIQQKPHTCQNKRPFLKDSILEMIARLRLFPMQQ